MNRILYLHGFASSPASSKARFFAERLRTAGARIDIPDLADGDFEHLTISGQLRVIARAGAGDPVALVGSSMGGYLAALYAARHPEVSRVVLLAPAFGFAAHWAERMGAEAVAAWRETGTVEVFHYGEKRQHPLSYALLDDGLRYEDYPDFRQPALIFHGAQDDIVPARYSGEFAATHPNAHLEILDSGHDLLNVLEYMAPKVCEFLAGP
jgi:pimeloyl-ACP methyl ester carboxylesterase